MLSKDAWRNASDARPLSAAAMAALWLLAGCHQLQQGVYHPAPTPIFMEEGLRDGAEGSPTQARSASEGLATEAGGDRQQGTADSRRDGQVPAEPLAGASQAELPPPTQPPAANAQSA